MTEIRNIIALLSLIAVKVGITPEEVRETLAKCEQVCTEQDKQIET